MDDVDMKLPNGSPSSSSPTPNPSDATPRKSVSFPLSADPPHAAKDSPVTAKILARKPTPFNNDLAATIRESGLGAVTTDDNRDPSRNHPPPQPADQPANFDFIGGKVLEEEEVDPEEAERARQISLARVRPPPTAPPS